MQNTRLCKSHAFFVVSKLMKGMSRLQKRSDERLPFTIVMWLNLPAVCSSNFEASLLLLAFLWHILDSSA